MRRILVSAAIAAIVASGILYNTVSAGEKATPEKPSPSEKPSAGDKPSLRDRSPASETGGPKERGIGGQKEKSFETGGPKENGDGTNKPKL